MWQRDRFCGLVRIELWVTVTDIVVNFPSWNHSGLCFPGDPSKDSQRLILFNGSNAVSLFETSTDLILNFT